MKVYHVSSNGDANDTCTGVLSAETMNSENPAVYLFMNSQDTDFVQYEVDGGQVIVTRDDADNFDPDVIQ
jgi:hypothetical protein